MATPSFAASVERLAMVNFTVTIPASSFEIATPVRSGEFAASPPGSANEWLFAPAATPARTSAATPTTASARQVDPAIARSLAQNLRHVIAPFPPASDRRRRLARAPRIPRTAEELPPRPRQAGQRTARILELHHSSMASGRAPCGARRLGLARHADVQARALRRLPVRPCVRRRAARAARLAAGARASVRLRCGE